MRTFLRLIWMGLLLVTVALVSALVTMRLAVHGREVDVPDLRGRTPSEAHRVAEDLGLATQIERRYYSVTVPEGRILSQTPPPGTVVRRGWELRLALSLGQQRVTIPDLIGASQRAAAITLEQRGLDSSVAIVNLPGSAAGQVLAQDPPANAGNVAAPEVSLLIAGNTPRAYLMPNFVGKPLGSVTSAVLAAGFALGKVTSTAGTGNPPLASQQPIATKNNGAAAIVIAQQPAAGTKIVTGTDIRLFVR